MLSPAILAVGPLLAGCAAGTGSPTPAATKPTVVSSPAVAPTVAPSPVASPPSGAPSQPAAQVEIRGFVFQPPELSVPMGTTVTWNNGDAAQHTVTADDRSFDSGLIQPGATFTHTFLAPGRYGYFCIPHGAPGSGQFGAIVVQ